MATTAISTSRVTYPVTLLNKIALKRKTAHARFVELATKDLHEVKLAETSRRGIKFHVNYVWA